MQIDINEIIIRNRVRRNLGDLATLMESLKRHGLLNPVVVNSRKELIAGHRRTEAARRLGWRTVEARVVDNEDAADLVEMEIEENTQRKNLTSDELAEAYLRLDRMRHPSLFVRIWTAVTRLFGRLFSRRRNAR